MAKANVPNSDPAGKHPRGLVPQREVCRTLGIHYNTALRQRKKGVFPLELILVGSRFYARQTDLDRLTGRES